MVPSKSEEFSIHNLNPRSVSSSIHKASPQSTVPLCQFLVLWYHKIVSVESTITVSTGNCEAESGILFRYPFQFRHLTVKGSLQHQLYLCLQHTSNHLLCIQTQTSNKSVHFNFINDVSFISHQQEEGTMVVVVVWEK